MIEKIEQERIEKDAIEYEDKNPYDSIHSAYYMGAKNEHELLVNFMIWFYRKQFGYTSDKYAKRYLDGEIKEYKLAIEHSKKSTQ